MSSYVLHFLAGFALSFIGSMPIGMINMTVAESTIRKGLKSGIIIAAGAAVVEFIQALIAVQFTSLFMDNPSIEQAIQWGSVLVFVGLGIYYMLAKAGDAPIKESKKDYSKTSDFFKGVLISALNVIVFPYWVFYSTYLGSLGWLSNHFYLLLFVSGVMFGTFAILYLYARLSLKIIDSVQKIALYTNRILAGLFFLLAIVQLIRLVI